MYINIDQIESVTTDPLYVLVAGGIASGKTTHVNKHIKNIPVMDVDDIMSEMGFKDYSPYQLSIAMQKISESIKDMMLRKESLVSMGTAANLQFTIDRLHWAKMAGYSTVLLYIDTPLAQAIKQNDHRVSLGGRGITAQKHKIEKSNAGAAKTVATLKNTALVDYFCHHQNIRDI